MRHLLHSIFIAVFLSLSLISTAGYSAQSNSYSSELQQVVQQVQKQYGTDHIWIAGGTARALIQHALQGTPFIFRDFDIVVNAKMMVTAESARKLGQSLEASGLGQFSEENLRPRPRYNPKISADMARNYNAGFGFYVIHSDGTEFDISLFHSEEAMQLNGILDTDKLTIKIAAGDNLAELIKDRKAFIKRIHDPASALPTILNSGIPKVVNWDVVNADPSNTAVRMVRAFAKFNALPLDEVTNQRLRKIIEADSSGNALQVSRNLIKLFEDQAWQKEFGALLEMGFFKKHFSSFENAAESAAFWKATSLTDKVARLLEQADKKDSLRFLKILANLEPELIQEVLPRLIRSQKWRVGYFTGEFSPFHKGHNGVVETALQKGQLDMVFVIPTPHATNDPKTKQYSPREWEERREFVKAGLSQNSSAWLWPFTKPEGTITLGQTIESLESFVALEKPLTHIFGMDSFYRVLARGLLTESPRPRIAVTRPGVPIPQSYKRDEVQVLENIYAESVSATRIMHEVALSGKTDELHPEVLKKVLQTDRYATLMKDTIQQQAAAAQAILPVTNWKDKTLIWDPRRNFAGLYESTFPEFTASHEKMLDELQSLGAKSLVIVMDNDAPARRSWKIEAQKRWLKIFIRIRPEYREVPATERVMVVHSGTANELLKSGYFADHFRGQKGLIIYETADQPLSPILRSIPAVKVIAINQCRALFTAAGF